MKSKEAVVKRINELCAVNDIALNQELHRVRFIVLCYLKEKT